RSVPARDDLPLAKLELERAAAVPGGVELLAGAEGDADVVHGDVRPGGRLGAVADCDVLDPELERDVSLGLVHLWALRCHRARTYTRARVAEMDDNLTIVCYPRRVLRRGGTPECRSTPAGRG